MGIRSRGQAWTLRGDSQAARSSPRLAEEKMTATSPMADWNNLPLLELMGCRVLSLREVVPRPGGSGQSRRRRPMTVPPDDSELPTAEDVRGILRSCSTTDLDI